jgi:hypothetical protein
VHHRRHGSRGQQPEISEAYIARGAGAAANDGQGGHQKRVGRYTSDTGAKVPRPEKDGKTSAKGLFDAKYPGDGTDPSNKGGST